MGFLLIIKSDAKAEAGVMPDEQLLSAMGKYNESLEIHSEGAGLDTCSIEVRPLFDLSDFAVDPADKLDGWRQQEQAFRERTGQT